MNKFSEWKDFQEEIPQNQTGDVQLRDKVLKNKEESTIENIQIQTKPKPSHHYRPDIDGLRTIAIATVIIFHAFPDFMTGGFIGVDVFFVISGYLISQIVIKETREDRFSYVNFYIRRIKRIYPALILTLAFVLCMVPKYYKPNDLDFTLKTLNASVFFGANLQIMWHHKDYFDPDIRVNPLLHLWSLGVEEQFYIFWPCLISIGLKFFHKKAFIIIGLYTIISFLFNVASVYQDTQFAFYFPICRFWQMSIGGLIAYFNYKIQNTRVNNVLSIAGTSAILVTVWIINGNSMFPGFWALVPTLSSACIIQAGSGAFVNKWILSNKIMVFLGKISYPMYLWHWPLFVISRYLFPEGSTSIFSNLYFLIFLTGVLSILTYFLVENPIRRRKSKIIVVILLMIMASIGVWSYINTRGNKILNGWWDDDKIQELLIRAEKQYIPRAEDYVQINGRMHPNLSKSKNRQSPTVESTKIPVWNTIWDYQHQKPKVEPIVLQKRIDKNSKYYMKFKSYASNFQVANQGKQNLLFIFGDSHAEKISYRFQQLFYDSVKNNKTDTFPTVVALLRRGTSLNQANPLMEGALNFIKQHKPKRVLLCSFFIIYLSKNFAQENFQYEDYFEQLFQQFFDFIKKIQDLNLGIEISALTLDMINQSYNPDHMVDFYGVITENIKPVRRSEFRNRYKRIFDTLEPGLTSLGVKIIDTSDNLCWKDVCQVTTPTGYGIFIDSNHPGKYTARHWFSVLDQLVQF